MKESDNMQVPWYISFIKLIFLNFCITYTFLKITNKKIDKIDLKIKLILFNLIFAIIYSILRCYIEISLLYPIYYLLYIFYFSEIISINFLYGITTIMFASSISLVSMFISGVINFIIMKIFSINTLNYSVIEYISVGIMQNSLLYFLFKIKRFKNGFSFLQNNNIKIVNIIGIFIGIATIILSIILGVYEKKITGRIIFFGILLGIVFIFNWIKTSITRFYKQRMKDRTVEIQSGQLKEKDEIISNLKIELSKVLEINHKYNRRLSAMERAVAKFGNKLSFDEELANEYSDVLDSLRDLSKEYKQEFDNYYVLPKTNIFSIDNLLEYMKVEALKSNIEFKLELNCEISEMIEKHISKNKLETLLSDHISDSIIAINSSDSANRKIKVIIGKIGEFYEVSILDTGIEFKIETLLKLGLERVTTHKDSGGSGIGFMTTFETLSDCRASLIIEEHDKEKDNYTKTVVVRFDNKNEYKVISARAEEIKKKDLKNRIIVV